MSFLGIGRLSTTYAYARSAMLKSCLLMAGFLTIVPMASAQFNGIGGYDLKSSADLAVGFDYYSTGKLDHIVLYRPGSGVVFIVEKQNGAWVDVFASFSGIGGYNLLSATDRIIAFDYSGNGHADHLLIYRPGSGVVWIMANNNGSFSPVFASFTGIANYDLKSVNDRIIAFDFDGSGREDHLVLYRPGSGIVFVVKNSNGMFTNQVTSFTGIGGYDLSSINDRLIGFDYYGIGSADHLVAYRPGSGIAFVLENNEGGGNFVAVQTSFNGIGGYDLKSTSDRLLAYDYSGTGSLDHLLAYRPGSGICFVIGASYFSYSPVFQSFHGIGGYDLSSMSDKIFTYDYNSTGMLGGLALYRSGSGVFFTETNSGGTFTDQARPAGEYGL